MAKEIQINGSNINGNSEKEPQNVKSINGKCKLNSSMSIEQLEEQFNACKNIIQNLPKNGPFQPSDQLKLKLYAFYKQATEGPNRNPKPSFYEIVNGYKWNSWAKLGDMPKEEAMKNYVNELKQIVEKMPYNDSISEFYDKFGIFSEFKKEKTNEKVKDDSKKLNGNQFSKDANYSSSNDSSSDSDDFSDTVDNLSLNGDSKPNSNDDGYVFKNQHFENKNNCFEDCTDINSKLEPGDVINAKGIDAHFLTGKENFFFDCIDKNSVLGPNDIICARGETGIFSSRTNFSSCQDQSSSSSRSFRQPLNVDNNLRSSDGSSYYQNTGGSGNGGDRNFNNQYSELNDIHEHLALTVLRLQQTVKSISNRIENLETKFNERQIQGSKKEIKKQNWWSNRTTQTTVFLILWPFAAHLIISAIKKKANK